MPNASSPVFIGSSSENKNAAAQIQLGLDKPEDNGARLCYATVWDEIFKPGDIVIETLLDESEAFDYAIMLLTPNDYTTVRGRRQLAPRDNLNFELGIFLARLGRKHCIIVRPNDVPMKLPTDLLGVVYITYNHREYVNGFSNFQTQITEIRNHIRKTGVRTRRQDFFQRMGLRP